MFHVFSNEICKDSQLPERFHRVCKISRSQWIPMLFLYEGENFTAAVDPYHGLAAPIRVSGQGIQFGYSRLDVPPTISGKR